MQKSYKLPKYAVDALGGIVQGVILSKTYTAPATADVDYIINEFEPTAGDWTDITANILNDGIPDVFRNATVTVTDANSSISVWIKLTGEDQFKNHQEEVLRVSAGEGNVVGQCIWSVVSSVSYKCHGTVGAGVDTVAVGIGDKLGLNVQIGDEADVLKFVSDTAGTPDDELAAPNTEVSAEFSSVLPTVNVADGAKLFWYEVRPTKPHEGVLPVRPRGTVVITTN